MEHERKRKTKLFTKTMQRLLDIIFNFHKLCSKRYFVVFFDKQNMPVEGDTITVGDFTAEFKKIPDEPEFFNDSVYKGIADMEIENYDSDTNLAGPVSHLKTIWECRKCHLGQEVDPKAEVIRCNNCGFRTVK